MEIIEIVPDEYDQIFENKYHIFNSASFNQLNSYKCEEVKYLGFAENGKIKLGLICGLKENSLFSPFSAPFGGFTFKKSDAKLVNYIDAVKCIKEYAQKNKYKSITITLPPSIYNENHISKQIHAFYINGYNLSKLDLNFQYNLDEFTDGYEKKIWHNARKNLRIAQKSKLTFSRCCSDEKKKLAYQVIQENRKSKGYPLRMTLQQVLETSNIINADYFLVYMGEMVIAAAIVFHINPTVVQVVYWGDRPGFSDYKPINYLAYSIFEYYKKASFKFIDIGPSTEDSIPNFGLCEFKESIGCSLIPKMTFKKEFD